MLVLFILIVIQNINILNVIKYITYNIIFISQIYFLNNISKLYNNIIHLHNYLYFDISITIYLKFKMAIPYVL